MLKETTLYGKYDKVEIAIERLKMFVPGEGYYGAFSGGKDSVAIKELVTMAGIQCDWHYNWTTVDPPEVLRFIKKYHPDVEIHQPILTMWQLIVKKRMPPTRLVRYCCEHLKERGGAGRHVLTGIRGQESFKRSKRQMVEHCFKDESKIYVNPILDWSENDVWEFIHKYHLSYCSLYDEGFTRIGCIMCPMNSRRMEKDAKRWPKYYQAYVRAFQRCIDKRIEDGLATNWQTGQEMMDWWTEQGKHIKQDPDQTIMFE